MANVSLGSGAIRSPVILDAILVLTAYRISTKADPNCIQRRFLLSAVVKPITPTLPHNYRENFIFAQVPRGVYGGIERGKVGLSLP